MKIDVFADDAMVERALRAPLGLNTTVEHMLRGGCGYGDAGRKWPRTIVETILKAAAPSAAHAPGVGDGKAAGGNAEYVLALLIGAGFVTQTKVDEARKIALGFADPPLTPNQAQVGGDAVRGEYRASDTMIDAAQAAFDCWAIRGRGGRIKNHREAIEKAVEAAFAQAQAPDAYMDHRRACIDADLRNAVPKYAELYTRPLYAAPVPPTAVTEAMIDAALGEYLTPSETNPGREISRARMRDALTAALGSLPAAAEGVE